MVVKLPDKFKLLLKIIEFLMSFTVTEFALRVEVNVTDPPDVTTMLFKGLVKPTALEKTKDPWFNNPCKVRFCGVVVELLLRVFSKETIPLVVVMAIAEKSETGFLKVMLPAFALVKVERLE